MSQAGGERTIVHWIRIRAVQGFIFITACMAILLYTAGYAIRDNPLPEYTILLRFIADIFGIMAAIVLGFYWNRAYDSKIITEENPIIINHFISELKDNQNRLIDLYASGGKIYLPNILKTTVYEIYQERLGKFEHPRVIDLNDIYHNLYVLNENIRKYPMTNDFKPWELERLVALRNQTKEKIDDWIKFASETWSI